MFVWILISWAMVLWAVALFGCASEEQRPIDRYRTFYFGIPASP